MAKPMRQPVNTTAAAVRIAQGLTRELQPPSHVPLDDCDWPFWESVVAEFARSEWSEHQLELAAFLFWQRAAACRFMRARKGGKHGMLRSGKNRRRRLKPGFPMTTCLRVRQSSDARGKGLRIR